jgi:sec-independent protein translocase protein TatA
MNILALGIGNLGGPDLFIILLIVLVLFGAKKLPDLARSLGQSMNEFRKAREDIDRQLHDTGASPSQPQSGQSMNQGAAAPSAQQATSGARTQQEMVGETENSR